MKKFIFILSLITFVSCSEDKETSVNTATEKNQEYNKPEIERVKTVPTPESIELETEKNTLSDNDFVATLTKLDSNYASVPFYGKTGLLDYYIVSNAKKHTYSDLFKGLYKYGIADDSSDILISIAYDKIYNPEQTIKNCFEIKLGDHVGLFNYINLEVLEPQFEFIIPEKATVSNTAYGYKSGKWYKIKASLLEKPKETSFDPTEVLKNVNYNIQKIKPNLMYDYYSNLHEHGPISGEGIVILPSYLEYFKFTDKEEYLDVLVDVNRSYDMGTSDISLNTIENKSFSENLKSFVISIYEKGIDARERVTTSKDLVFYSKKNNQLNSYGLYSLNEYDYYCREGDFSFINDSIIEIKTNSYEYDLEKEDQLYNYETEYRYIKINSDGELINLSSNRHFDFTKFIYITEEHFKGCLSNHMTAEERIEEDGLNMWMYDHYSIEDLDIMRNEIFADYGYKFQSEKWQQYFGSKKWYQPRFDDVSEQLTEIDKANIQLILKVKEKMKGKENEFTNKRKSHFVAAG